MNAKKVLIVAPEPMLNGDFAQRLRSTGYWVECVASGEAGVKAARSLLPDVVVVGDSLPDVSPVELTWNIKSAMPEESTPVFVVDLSVSKIRANAALQPALASNHDPSETEVGIMVERIDALFRPANGQPPEPDTIQCHGIRLDRGRHRAWVEDKLLRLTPTEFKLLWELARRPGYVLSRVNLTKFCRGTESTVQARTIDAHIKSIRRKLGDRSKLIETVHGVGYRFQESTSAAAWNTNSP